MMNSAEIGSRAEPRWALRSGPAPVPVAEEGRLLAQAILFGLAAGLFLVLLGGLRAAVVVAAGAVAAGLVLL